MEIIVKPKVLLTFWFSNICSTVFPTFPLVCQTFRTWCFWSWDHKDSGNQCLPTFSWPRDHIMNISALLWLFCLFPIQFLLKSSKIRLWLHWLSSSRFLFNSYEELLQNNHLAALSLPVVLSYSILVKKSCNMVPLAALAPPVVLS